MGAKGSRPQSRRYHPQQQQQQQQQQPMTRQNNNQRTGQAVQPNGVANQPSAVRCPRCRRLLQLPEGHSRFLCVCGQMLMSPNAVQQTQRVRCPSCGTTLLPPAGAPVFRCPCGQHLRSPLQASASTANMVPKSEMHDADQDDTAVASTMQRRGSRRWVRTLIDNDEFGMRWMRLLTDEEENELVQLQLDTNENFSEEMLIDMSTEDLKERMKMLGIPVSEKADKDEVVSQVLVCKQTLMGKSEKELKNLLMNVGADFSNCVEQQDFVDRLFTTVWREEARKFTDGYVRAFTTSNELTWMPATEYTLDCKVDGTPEKGIPAKEIFDTSNKGFNQKLKWIKEEMGKLRIKWEEGHVKIRIHRSRLLEDSFVSLSKIKPYDYRRYFRFEFIDEPGVDAGGVAREWFSLTGDAVFNLDFGLFEFSGVDNICYQINPSSEIANELHLQYFRFVGRLLGKAVFDGQTLNAHLVQTLYKHLLAWPVTEKDVEFVDPEIYESFKDLRSCEDVSVLYLDFTTAVRQFGETRQIELKPGGEDIDVTNENREEYLMLMMKHIMLERVKPQLQELLLGFYEIVPLPIISIFDYQEFELLMCGLPEVDVNDWRKNSRYKGEYERKGESHKVVKWFWEIMGEYTQEQRARFLQFATGTSRVPVQGFAYLQGSDGKIKPFTIESVKLEKSVFPLAHTCFNRIELPLYKSKEQAERFVSMAVQAEATGFGIE